MSPTRTIRRQTNAVNGQQQPQSLPAPEYAPPLPLRSQRAPRVLHAITPSKMAGAETFLARLTRRASLDQFVNHFVTSRSRANLELLAANLPFDRIGIGGKANLLAVPRLALAARRFQADLLHSHLSTAKLVVRVARAIRRPTVDRTRSRLYIGEVAPPPKPSDRVFQRRPPGLSGKGNSRQSHHGNALSDRSERHAAHAHSGRHPPRIRS